MAPRIFDLCAGDQAKFLRVIKKSLSLRLDETFEVKMHFA